MKNKRNIWRGFTQNVSYTGENGLFSSPLEGVDVRRTDEGESKTKNFWDNGYSASEYIGRILKHTAIRNIDDLFDYSDVNKYIEIVAAQNITLVDNIIPDFVSVAEIRYILSNLLRENVSIRDIVYIFEKINDYAEESSRDDLLDKIRVSLARHISKPFANDEGIIQAIAISDKTYDSMFDNSHDVDNIIRIDGTIAEKIVKKLMKSIKTLKIDIDNIIILAPLEIRHVVYVILSKFLPDIRVAANEEISNEYTLEIIDEI